MENEMLKEIMEEDYQKIKYEWNKKDDYFSHRDVIKIIERLEEHKNK